MTTAIEAENLDAAHDAAFEVDTGRSNSREATPIRLSESKRMSPEEQRRFFQNSKNFFE